MGQGWKVLGFTSAFTVLGLAFHGAAEGSVSWGGLFSVGLIALIVAVPSSRIKITIKGLPLLFGALFAGQLLMHMLLSLTTHGAQPGTHSLIPTMHMTAMHLLAALISGAIVFYAGTIAQAWSRFLSSIIGVDFVVVAVDRDVVTAPTGLVTRSITFFNSDEMFTRGPPASSVSL